MTKIDLHEATREQLVEAAGLRPLVADAVLKARDERGGGIADIGALKDALGEVKGIGPATLDQLGDVLKVGRRAARPADEKPAEAAPPAARAGADEPVGRARPPRPPLRSWGRVPGAAGRRRGRGRQGRSPDGGGDRPPPRPWRPASRREAGPWRGRPGHPASAPRAGGRRAADKTAEVALTVVRGGVEAAERATGGLVEAERAVVARSGEAVGELGRLVAELVNEQVRANVEALQALGRARTWPEVLEAHAAFFRGNLERMTDGAGRYLEAVTRMAAGLAGGGRDKDEDAA